MLKPNGICILSYHGICSSIQTAWGNNPAELSAFFERGYRVAHAPNRDLVPEVPENLYCDVAYTPSYVEANWGKVVDIQMNLLGGFSGFQDIIVFKRKSSYEW